jgi:hypothetical protein
VDAAVGQDHHDPPIRGGLGAILTQVQDGFTRPIGYYSRQFRESECKYNAYNAELAGIVASLNHFYQYLKGSKTTIFTDHLPIMKKSKAYSMRLKLYGLYLLAVKTLCRKFTKFGPRIGQPTVTRFCFLL